MTKTKTQFIYKCKSFRKLQRIKRIKRFFTWSITLWAFFSVCASINAYIALIDEITHTRHSIAVVDPVEAQILPTKGEDIIRLVAKQKGFEDVQLLLDIAFCESSYNYRAYNINKNGTTDSGIFMFNSIHKFGEKPLDPYWATAKAIEWIRAGKINAWSASKSCWQAK